MSTPNDSTKSAITPQPSAHWREDCEKWRGHLLTGKYAHWCFEYDELPVDETCMEWPCGCYPEAADQRDNTIANLRETIRELSFWQPISEAPKDGTPVFVYENSIGTLEVIGIAAYQKFPDGQAAWIGSSILSKDGNSWTTIIKPTLWRPLFDWPTKAEGR